MSPDDAVFVKELNKFHLHLNGDILVLTYVVDCFVLHVATAKQIIIVGEVVVEHTVKNN